MLNKSVLLDGTRMLLPVFHGLRGRGGIRRESTGTSRHRREGALRGRRAIRMLGHVHVLAVLFVLLTNYRATDPTFPSA